MPKFRVREVYTRYRWVYAASLEELVENGEREALMNEGRETEASDWRAEPFDFDAMKLWKHKARPETMSRARERVMRAMENRLKAEQAPQPSTDVPNLTPPAKPKYLM